MVSAVLQEIPQLINEIDLHITQLAIQLVTLIMGLSVAANAKAMLNDILPNIYQIVKSPLLHGELCTKVRQSLCCWQSRHAILPSGLFWSIASCSMFLACRGSSSVAKYFSEVVGLLSLSFKRWLALSTEDSTNSSSSLKT